MSLRSFLNRWLPLACAAAGALASAGSLNAQTETFASFTQVNGNLAANRFYYTNNGTSASFGTQNPVPVRFNYENTTNSNFGASPQLQGQQNATMTFTSSTTVTAVDNGGGNYSELFTNVTTIVFTRTTPAGVGSGTQTNLLTVTMTNYTQSFGGGGSSLDASTPSATVTFTSDFLNFNNTTIRVAALGFTGGSTTITQNANGFLNNFNIQGTGNFSSNPIPVVTVPEMSPSAILGLIVAGAAAAEFGRQRLRRRASAPAPAKDDEPALV